MAEGEPTLAKEKHVRYWKRCHSTYLPQGYTANDSTRLLFASFILCAYDLLSTPLTPLDRTAIRTWVLNLQHPDGGFCGSPTHSYDGQLASKGTANLATTSFALILLALAAEDEDEARSAFHGVRRKRLLRWMRRLQREDGSFGQNLWEGEIVGGRDMRHSYLASMIRWMLRGDVKEGDEEWVEDIDVEKMVQHISSVQTYDGGLSESANHESHAGYAFCGIAALALLDRPPSRSTTASPESALSRGILDKHALLNFLAHRQFMYASSEENDSTDAENYVQLDLQRLSLGEECRHAGLNGRSNKKADTCYCWWVGGALSILGHPELINAPPARRYLLDITQHTIGGFSKTANSPPDIYHSYLGLAALALMGGKGSGLKEFDVLLCCSTETVGKIEAARDGLFETGRE